MGSLLPIGVAVRRSRKIRSALVGARVAIDDVGVRCELRDGHTESVRWDELLSCYAITTSGGPGDEDVFFVFEARNGKECLVPQAAAPDGFFDRVGRLPGFDSAKLVEAMVSTSNAKFVLWRAEP